MANREVTQKSTKDVIYRAYQAAQEEIKRVKSQKLNPVEKKTAKRKQATAEKVKELSVDAVSKTIETLNNRADSYLTQLRNEFEGELGNLSEVQQAVQDARAELEEIFGINAEAESLAALVEAQSQARVIFEEQMKVERQAFNEKIEQEKKAWKLEQADHEQTFERKVQADHEERTRELEDARYSFERQQKEQRDALNDELALARKQLTEEIETAHKNNKEEKEAFFKDRRTQEQLEEMVRNFETKIAGFESEKHIAIEAALEEGKKKAATSYGIEVSAVKRGYEADMKVLEGQVENLAEDNANLRNQVASLQAKLEDAYAKVQDVAVQALNAQSNANTVKQVQDAVAAATNGKK